MRLSILILSLLFPFLSVAAQPKHEVRAAWLTALYGLDWPCTRAVSPQSIRKQKEELVDILDKLKAANFNTVLFQTRTRGDVLYPSSIEPFNSILTGKSGGNPGYDPLAFAIEECHKRGMECHAWMVTIPLGNRKHVASLGNRSVTKRMKDICVPYKNEYFLNPGHPGTKEYLMKLVREVVSRYDIDGVHFDYLRYPENAPLFPDKYDFRRYGKGRTLDQWRRDNISEIVRYIYKDVNNEALGEAQRQSGWEIPGHFALSFPWVERFLHCLSRPARLAWRRYYGPDISNDVFSGKQFLSFCP